MMKSILLRSCSSPPLLVEAKAVDLRHLRQMRSPPSVSTYVTCSSSTRSKGDVPKLEPFSRSKLQRVLKDPPLIQKAENELADYCSTLEGDDSYSCWRAYFELKDLERESSKGDVEKLILQAGGVKSLIGCLHGVSSMSKGKTNAFSLAAPSNAEKERASTCPVPDGLPKSMEELEEEERARMPDSPYTRLLRTKGRFPAWYSPAPDHETD